MELCIQHVWKVQCFRYLCKYKEYVLYVTTDNRGQQEAIPYSLCVQIAAWAIQMSISFCKNLQQRMAILLATDMHGLYML